MHPTSFFSYNWLGGAVCVAPTGRDLDVRLGGVIRAAPANLLLGIGSSGCYNAALVGVTPTLLCSGQLGLQGPLSHSFSELFGLCL